MILLLCSVFLFLFLILTKMFICNFNSPIIPFRVLVVDDDFTHLSTVENILLSFGYEVNKLHSLEAALLALHRNSYMSDILVCGVTTLDLYAHRLVRFVGLELDIPVVLMSLDCSKEFVSKGILNGATRCLPKPIQPEDLKNIWQFVVSKWRNQFAFFYAQIRAPASFNSAEPSSEIVGGLAPTIAAAAHGGGPSCSNPKPKLKKRQESTTNPKKPRFIWTDEHDKIFLDAIKAQEFERVVPTKILKHMRNHGVTNITRENVASRLQKYRNSTRKNNEIYGSSKLSSQPYFNITNGDNLMSFSANQTLSIENNTPSSCFTPNLPPFDETLFLDKNMKFCSDIVVHDQGIVPTTDFDQNMINNASKVSQENDIRAMEHPQPPQVVPLEQDKGMVSVDLPVTNNQLLPPPTLSNQIFDVDGNKDSSNELLYHKLLEDYEAMYLNDCGNGFL